MAREEQRAHVRQMRWAREHGRGEPVRCGEYDEGDEPTTRLSTRSQCVYAKVRVLSIRDGAAAGVTGGIPRLRGAAPSSRRP